MDRIVDIQTNNRHLAAFRGFLTVNENGEEIGRVPLDDIAAVIVHAHGVTYSNNLLVALSERGATLVVCASNHAPVACVWPLAGHHAQGARMRAQWDAPKPLCKQIWRRIVVSKIQMQAAILSACGEDSGAFDLLARKVRSGDPENVEAQAARRYWPLMFGAAFRRDRAAGGVNSMLNYGYTVARAVVSRSIVAAGLHPTIGVHHRNRANAFALSDDLVEPFRPIVDCMVWSLTKNGATDVTPETKAALARVIAFDLHVDGVVSPLSVAVQKLAQSVANSFEAGAPQLTLPQAPSSLEVHTLAAPA